MRIRKFISTTALIISSLLASKTFALGIGQPHTFIDTNAEKVWVVHDDIEDDRLFYYLPESFSFSLSDGHPDIFSYHTSSGNLVINFSIAPNWDFGSLTQLQKVMETELGRPIILAPVILNILDISQDLDLQFSYKAKTTIDRTDLGQIEQDSAIPMKIVVPASQVQNFYSRVISLGGFNFPVSMEIETVDEQGNPQRLPFSTSFIFGGIEICYINPHLFCD